MNENMNGAPIGDQNTIRIAQHLLQLAQQGTVVGACLIGITPDGQVHQSMALPPTPAAVMIAIGGLESIKHTLIDQLKTAQQQQQVSRIIKPAAALQR